MWWHNKGKWLQTKNRFKSNIREKSFTVRVVMWVRPWHRVPHPWRCFRPGRMELPWWGLSPQCHCALTVVSPQGTRAPTVRRTSLSATAAPACPAVTAWSSPGPTSMESSRGCRWPSATTGPKATSAAAHRASPVRAGSGEGILLGQAGPEPTERLVPLGRVRAGPEPAERLVLLGQAGPKPTERSVLLGWVRARPESTERSVLLGRVRAGPEPTERLVLLGWVRAGPKPTERSVPLGLAWAHRALGPAGPGQSWTRAHRALGPTAGPVLPAAKQPPLVCTALSSQQKELDRQQSVILKEMRPDPPLSYHSLRCLAQLRTTRVWIMCVLLGLQYCSVSSTRLFLLKEKNN